MPDTIKRHVSRHSNAGGPYSHASIVDGLAFIAGQVAGDATEGRVEPGDIEIETEKVMQILKGILEELGLGFEDVLRTNVYMLDLAEFDRMNKIYGRYFRTDQLPARTTVGVAQIVEGCRVEIDCIARVRTG
jgi:2-iminobutanoate/2-iminopropanoate deaminase